jgi:large subunit ribosomal protein L29e
MHFARKYNKKGLKKMQANNAKAVSACAEAIKALGEASGHQAQDAKRPQTQLSGFHRSP